MLGKKTALICFLLAPTSAWAQGTQAPQPSESLKIGFVRGLDMLRGTEEGKIRVSALQGFIEEKQREYDSRREELDRQTRGLEAQRVTLNAEAVAGMQRDIEQKERALRRFQEDTVAEIEQRREEITADLREKTGTVVQEYAQQNGMQVLFMLNDYLIYLDPALDVTDDILRIYNEKHPVSQAAPTPTQQ